MRRGRSRPAGAAPAALLLPLLLLLPLTGCDRLAAAPAEHAAAAGDPAQDADRGRRLPPVVDHVRTDDPVVFLTYDDGAERDPAFAAT